MITQLLEKLTELYAKRDLLALDKKAAIPAEVQQILSDIEAEFQPKQDAINTEVSEIEAQVKSLVLEAGETAKGGSLQAVYTKGRITWDTKSLDGYAKANPAIAEYRKQGEPSVSIRKVG
jgi:ElaB/YqjD/DUF883 family membrane-anchored ribosome-binding protein